MKKRKTVVIIFLYLLFFTNLNCYADFQKAEYEKFRLGNQVLLDSSGSLSGKKVAVLTNQTGILPDGTHIIDALIAKGINIVKIFSPEHGIRGDESYAETDKTGIPIISLYNGKVKPSKNDLADVDVIIYDIQDVGARFYTYTSTLYYAIEAASENQKEFIVCDRPMIVNPNYTGGFMLDEGYSSFVGKIPAPQAYGMTCGELAAYLNTEVYGSSCELKVMKMTAYQRNTEFNTLGLTWVKPSPSMFYPSTAVCYLASCLLEGTNVSEGRGTDKPFEYFGAPWVNSEAVITELNSNKLEGVSFEPVTFTPSEKISAYPPKFFNQVCSGVFINVSDKSKFNPALCGAAILIALYKNCPEFKFNKDNFIDKLAGTDKLRKMIISGSNAGEIEAAWQSGLNEFNLKRSGFLFYK